MRLLRPLTAVVLFAGISVPVLAPDRPETVPGPVQARVLRVIDGDTIIVRARIWLGQNIDTQVRLAGVDAPEIKGKCELERRLAVRARKLVSERSAGGTVVLSQIHYGKYAGRVVARVHTPDGKDLSELLKRAGLGRSYDGGRRPLWCDGP
ncbi:MAG: thermonuclease family protein [Alphaproteobacteria bacterium]|nr:thermonuclease family protein [Alphaproteobacteria bacterium]